MKQKLLRPIATVLVLALLASPALAWEKSGEYSEGMVLVTEGDKWGYANSSGTLAISPRFDEAEPFDLGAALVKENGKYGLLRQDGAWLLEPLYGSLTSLGSGIYIGEQNGAWKLLSTVPIPDGQGGSTNQFFEDASSITVESVDGVRTLVFRRGAPPAEGEEDNADRLAVSGLSKLLKERQVPGWAFPLKTGRTALFSDVSGKDWFDLWVDLSYNLGLMEGPGDGKFWPYRTLTVGEALKLAAVLDSRQKSQTFQSGGSPWYQNAVDYCVKNGIITSSTFDDYARPITRAEMALVFAATAPLKDALDLNDARRVQSSIPDVAAGDFAASSIFALYSKGIVSGSDKQLTFRPDAVITRNEVAAIVARLARPEQRLSLWPTSISYYRSAASER